MKEKKSSGKRTVLMMGNPNVGKSALFNKLTGASAVVSNYPGTTVDFTRGTLIQNRENYEIIDVPGAYSLDARDAAEEVAVRILRENPDAIVLLVLDATRLERGLYLGLEVMEQGNPTLVAVNMIDSAHDKQIAVDTNLLQKLFGVPVVPTSAISGEGLKELGMMLPRARPAVISDISDRARNNAPAPEPAFGCAGCGGCMK